MLQTDISYRFLVVLKVRSPQKAQSHLPQPAGSSIHGNVEEATAQLFGVMETGSALTHQTPGNFSGLF